MALLKYTASIDNTITNTYKPDLETRATGSNMGKSDVLETFSIFGRINSSSQELSRTLIQFPTSKITSDRAAGTIPASGSVSFSITPTGSSFETPIQIGGQTIVSTEGNITCGAVDAGEVSASAFVVILLKPG